MVVIEVTEPAPGAATAPLNPTVFSQKIAELVTEELLSLPGIDAATAVARADGRLLPEQRGYLIEFKDAAAMLNIAFPQIWQEAWLITLKNNMGYRLVEIPICGYRYSEDPVSRKCVRVTLAPKNGNGEKAALLPAEDKTPWLTIAAVSAGAYLVGKRFFS